MKKILFLIITAHFIYSQSFTDNAFIGSRSMSMAGAVVSHTTDVESAFYNPAGLANLDEYSMMMGVTSLYGVKFLKHQFLSVGLPKKIAISFQQLGTSTKGSFGNNGSYDYNLSTEKSISLSQGFSLLKDANSSLSVGYSLNGLIFYQNISAGPSGNGTNGLSSSESTVIGVDFGILASLRNKISFGAFIKNINNPTLGRGSSQSHLPRRMNFGITYNPFDRLFTTVTLERISGDNDGSFKFGTEYIITNAFTIRSGIQMNPNRFGFGISYSIKKIDISYSLLTHPVLSESSILSFKVNFEK